MGGADTAKGRACVYGYAIGEPDEAGSPMRTIMLQHS